MRGFIAFIVFAASGSAAQRGVVPSDAANLSAAESRPFVESICPGRASPVGCSACPAGTSSPDGRWELRAVTFGNFLAPDSEDALVSGTGCEPQANGGGGDYLFTKDGASWRKVRYTPGGYGEDCKKVSAADGRDLLVCESWTGHRSVEHRSLYLWDAGQDATRRDVFLDVKSSGDCGKLESVAFGAVPGRHGLRIFVTAQQDDCKPAPDEFFFDGRKIVKR